MSVDSSREAFLTALERLLSQDQAAEPGINAVAREAGLNKVLLYRYFGTWDGLLAAFAQRVNPWRDLRLEIEAGLATNRWATLRELMTWLFTAYLDRLQASPLLQNLLRLSFVHRDPLQVALEKDREEEGLTILKAVGARFPLPATIDGPSLTAILVGGLTWLALMGPRAGVFNGLRFVGPDADASQRLHQAIETWVIALTSDAPNPNL